MRFSGTDGDEGGGSAADENDGPGGTNPSDDDSTSGGSAGQDGGIADRGCACAAERANATSLAWLLAAAGVRRRRRASN